jgi:hypothetical protein
MIGPLSCRAWDHPLFPVEGSCALGQKRTITHGGCRSSRVSYKCMTPEGAAVDPATPGSSFTAISGDVLRYTPAQSWKALEQDRTWAAPRAPGPHRMATGHLRQASRGLPAPRLLDCGHREVIENDRAHAGSHQARRQTMAPDQSALIRPTKKQQVRGSSPLASSLTRAATTSH